MPVPWDSFNPDLITVDWMHGPRTVTRSVGLRYKPNMGKAGVSVRDEYMGQLVCFTLPGPVRDSLRSFDACGKTFTRMDTSACPAFARLIETIYERVSHLLNGQLRRYSKRLVIKHRILCRDSFACRVADPKVGGSSLTLALSKAIVLHGRTLHLPFYLL